MTNATRLARQAATIPRRSGATDTDFQPQRVLASPGARLEAPEWPCGRRDDVDVPTAASAERGGNASPGGDRVGQLHLRSRRRSGRRLEPADFAVGQHACRRPGVHLEAVQGDLTLGRRCSTPQLARPVVADVFGDVLGRLGTERLGSLGR